MAKDTTLGMTEEFKTVPFGGYDKNAVDYYIENMKSDHAREVDELKDNVNKLSEAVLSLKTMREVNLSESNKTISGLEEKNAAYESEIAELKEQVAAYKQKEFENAGRYESISRTLLEARESADALMAETNAKCQAQEAEVNARLEELENNVKAQLTSLEEDTTAKCQAMYEEAETSCANMKEQAYADSKNMRDKAHENAEALTAQTEYECRVKQENAEAEAERIMNEATSKAYILRKQLKQECDVVSNNMKEMLLSLDKVVDACNNTQSVADNAFSATPAVEEEAAQ